ncbi:SpoIIE-like protein phosphatase domain protein [Leptospira ryugenii]|uniref:SpoIIE-like protein phosphatase domain protein n=2 Tax=Leptospira ryugenii TaxID=1917863 RepID=A0A2P2E3Z5_9LEPT|nr:SpoIIE-like protein phosphatase domain protein [Leptospira ryugenii]
MFVPGTWTERYPLAGRALYSLQLHSLPKTGIYGIKVFEFPQAYRLYVDGILVHENGRYGEDLNDTTRSLVRPTLFFAIDKNEFEIAIEVANKDEIKPGPRKSILFGTSESILSLQSRQHFTDFVSLGILGIMFLYHLVLFLQRKKELGSLIFAIFCAVMFSRILVTEEHYLLKLIPNFPVTLEWYLDVGSFMVLTPILASLFYFNFTHLFRKKIHQSIYLFFSFFSLSYFIFKIEWIFNLLLVGSFLSGVYFFLVLIKAVFIQMPGARIFLTGWTLFLITSAFDMLAYNQIFRTNYISHLGFIFYIFSQAYFLSIKFNRALQVSEDLSESLELKVAERTEQLNDSLNLIHADLNLAKKLQESLIMTQNKEYTGLLFDYLYLPQAEVGGDFFDYRRISDDKYRVFLADATGHGVQAAMVTMIMKSECDRFLSRSQSISDIMFQINQLFVQRYLSVRMLFSAILVEIDLTENRISFVSAGHPAQFLIRNSKVESIKPKGRIIGWASNETFQEETRAFAKGDKVCLFSDGVYEDFNQGSEMYGEERWIQSVQKSYSLSPKEMIDRLWKERFEFTKKEAVDDDSTLIVMERT